MKKVLLFLLFLSTFQGFAQDYKRTNNWYFGANAGINFSTTPPTALTNGAMNTYEGCASISDTNGNLLFYTNGETVYNKNHQIMQNGTGLFGDWSSTQSCIIVPQPGNDSLFYIFTTYASLFVSKGLRAHLVNTRAQNGLGEVIMKNLLLANPVCQKLTATRHQNGRDVWVLAQGFMNNFYYAYLVTDKGLVPCPVVTAIGEVIGRDYGFGILITDAIGTLKFSIDGKKVANGIENVANPSMDILDFNSGTGKLSNLLHIPLSTSDNAPYSVEFSPNRKYLYYTDRYNYICRFNLLLGTSDSMLAHRDTILPPNPTDTLLFSRHTGLQLTPDGRIFNAFVDSLYLSSIEFPDSVNCGFKLSGFTLGGKRSRYGLPNFITSYFNKPRITFNYLRECSNDSISFFGFDTLNRNSWNWQFKKLSDNSTVNAFVQNPVSTFTDTGNYEVRLIVGGDTVIKTLHVGPPMQVNYNLGNDTTLCSGDSLLLNAGNGYYCYRWQDLSPGPTYVAKQTGTYVVTVTDNDFCQVQDSIRITFNQVLKPALNRRGDTLFATIGNYTYQWYFNNQPVNGANQSFIVRTADGNYHVKITDDFGCFTFSDTYNTTGLPVINSQSTLIYPNPVSGLLSVELIPGSEPIKQVLLRNYIGQTVYERLYPENDLKATISCVALPEGVYLLELSTQTKTYNQKIIITK